MSISNETILNLTTQIDAEPRGWDGPAGTDLLGILHDLLAGVCHRQQRHVFEGVSIAWELLAAEGKEVLAAEKIGALLRTKVRWRLIDIAEAEKMLCSVADGGKERTKTAGHLPPIGLEERADAAAETTTSGERPAGTAHTLLALQIASDLIFKSSPLSLEAARNVVDSMCDSAALARTGSQGSPVAARARALAAAPVGVLLDVDPEHWKAVVALVFGTQAGTSGLIESELAGELNDSWDAVGDKRIRAASKRMGLVCA